MGAFFAVQVRTGQEIKAKEMLKYVLEQKGVSIVKAIFANETHTKFVKNDTLEVSECRNVTEEDIQNHLRKERINNSINNRRQQLEVIESQTNEASEILKEAYRKEISKLQREVHEIREDSKVLKSVLSGYILIELHTNSVYLPNELWHMIKSVPVVTNILSTTPIPEEEIEFFFDKLETLTDPEVVMDFDKAEAEEVIDKKRTELLIELNNVETDKKEKERIENELDELNLNIVEKVNDFLETKGEKLKLPRIVAFVKRNKKFISMPNTLFNKLYNEDERNSIWKFLKERDFINRFTTLLNNKTEMEFA